MLKHLKLAVVGLLLPLGAHAATLTPCLFAKYAGQVMPLPSSSYLHYRIVLGDANISVTQAVPVMSGHIIWSLQTGGANWQQGWRSPNTNPLGSAAPVVSTANTNWEPNPVARTLDFISGTTVNDIPNQTAVSSDTSNTWVAGSYCYQ